MNKQDITIVAILSLMLVGWFVYQSKVAQQREMEQREQAMRQATNETLRALSPEAQASARLESIGQAARPDDGTETASQEARSLESVDLGSTPSAIPESRYVLSNDLVRLTISSKGAALTQAVLPHYKATKERDSGAVELHFDPSPALALRDMDDLGSEADFELVAADEGRIVLQRVSREGLRLTRTIALESGYQVAVNDKLENLESKTLLIPEHGVSLGATRRGNSRNDVLGVDSLSSPPAGQLKYDKVRHWDTKLNRLFGGQGGGCAGAPAAEGLPLTASTEVNVPQEWVSLKSRFFLQAFKSDAANSGYKIEVARLDEPGALRLRHATVQVRFPAATMAAGETLNRNHQLYIGPKKLELVRRFGPKAIDMMQFGFFKWMCVILLPILNFFYMLIPNYGIAVILLTMLVRIAFWPLTHKSTDSMKRMQALQPQLKEVQSKFKEDPQKMQQETWKIYRENKVNPMASCLPMLIQIPVFIALFTVLRSAVELRFAPFLWIADLSEPENLLAGMLPIIPALNILPFLMAGTMLLQSRMTPSMGDPAQQKMMMWMMPAMMLFMFYSMPSALVLYWTVSQVLAIVQLYWQRRKPTPDVVGAPAEERPMSRQVRRQLERSAKKGQI